MVKLILLMGSPCCGKSSVAKSACKFIGNLDYISSGDIARTIAMTDIAALHKLNSGGLAPEDIMRSQIKNAISKSIGDGRDIILDGFPRFQDQFVWLIDNFDDCTEIIKVFIDISPTTVILRAQERARDDDRAIDKRIDFYYSTTEPMIKSMYNVNVVNGALPKDIVLGDVLKIIKRRR
jgi:adenylate kinase family enzyme